MAKHISLDGFAKEESVFPMTPWIVILIIMLGVVGGGGVCWPYLRRTSRHRATERQDAMNHRLVAAFAGALEAAASFDPDFLTRIVRQTERLAKALALPADEMQEMAAAARLHRIGLLGVPGHILHHCGPLTGGEEAMIREHAGIAADLLDAIPLPPCVARTVRHQMERWDGAGFPDRLTGEQIPRGSRILAVAGSYCELRQRTGDRAPLSHADAMVLLGKQSGRRFDPAIVAAFRSLPEDSSVARDGDVSPRTTSALGRIASAQHETLGLYALASAITSSLHTEHIANTLLTCTRSLIPCASYALFLPDEDGEYLRARAALGVNERRLLGSLAQVGAYLTGRAFSRCEATTASFLADDLLLRDVSDPWIPFRSTLIVPLTYDNRPLGTINLYSEEPDAFGPGQQRVLRMIAMQAGRALHNANSFMAVQETAYTDALTGLRNARYLREFLEKESNRARREGTQMAVLNIDLDNFKPINDLYGHARGDQTLRDVAKILQNYVRNYDLAARYAGDEFVVVLAQASREVAEAVSVKLKQAVAQYSDSRRTEDPKFPKVGISVGIAVFPDDSEDVQGLLCRSDFAMYQDKESHRCGRPAVLTLDSADIA